MSRVRVIPAVVRQEALPAAEVEVAAEEVPPAEAADTASKNRTFDDKYRTVCPVFLYSSGIVYSVK